MLLHHGAKPNALDPNGFTALFYAIGCGSAEAVRELIAGGADVNIPDADGYSVLIYAIERGSTDAVRELIAGRADVNMPDKEGRPPLACLSPPLSDTSRQIEELLIKAGADTDYNRRRGIWTTDFAGKPGTMIFSCPTNSINHYTLLGFLATLYEVAPESGGVIPQGSYAHYNSLVTFPDFARVAIHRLEGKRAEVLHVNVADILRSADGSKDVALQAGDLIEIPKQEHKVADKWWGLSSVDVTGLNKCLWRSVQVLSQGHTNEIALVPSFGSAERAQTFHFEGGQVPLDLRLAGIADAVKALKADAVVRSFLLNKVVRDANVLLNTWDLSRVRLQRGGTTVTFDLTANPPPSVWLENGDVLEIPELGQPAPVTEAK